MIKDLRLIIRLLGFLALATRLSGCSQAGLSTDQDASPRPPFPNQANELDQPRDLPEGWTELIQSFHGITEKISIDGRGQDWSHLPGVEHHETSELKSHLDIIAFKSALTQDDLLLMWQLRGAPIIKDGIYGVDWDVAGSYLPDLRLTISPFGTAKIEYLNGWSQGQVLTIAGTQMVCGEVVEARIPLSSLVAKMPSIWQKILSQPEQRAWLRLFPWTNGGPSQPSDYGTPQANYRFLNPPVVFLDQLPPQSSGYITMKLPVDGTWFVSQGPYSDRTHLSGWYYDLEKVADDFNPAKPYLIPNSQNSLSFAAPIFAPFSGRILTADDHQDDGEIYEKGTFNEGNQIVIEADNRRESVRLMFLRHQSLTVQAGSHVEEGQPLATLGAQGPTRPSHLHMDGYLKSAAKPVPLVFKDVWVQLHPGPQAPWRRFFGLWQVREGYFVTKGDSPAE